MVSQHSSQGSFEILVDGNAPDDRGQGPKSPKGGNRGIIIVLVVIVALAALGTVFVFGGEEDVIEVDEESGQGSPLRPYVASEVPDTPVEEEPDDVRQLDDEEPYRPRLVEEGFQGERYHRDEDTTISPSSQPVDGDRIQVDTRGTRISRREANDRVKRELESIQNSERTFERRLRRREAMLHSRIFLPDGQGGAQVAPGVEIDDNLRRRIQEEFRNRERPTSYLPEARHHEYGDGVTYPSISESWSDGESADEELESEW